MLVVLTACQLLLGYLKSESIFFPSNEKENVDQQRKLFQFFGKVQVLAYLWAFF